MDDLHLPQLHTFSCFEGVSSLCWPGEITAVLQQEAKRQVDACETNQDFSCPGAAGATKYSRTHAFGKQPGMSSVPMLVAVTAVK